jgi:hypothetical protein
MHNNLQAAIWILCHNGCREFLHFRIRCTIKQVAIHFDIKDRSLIGSGLSYFQASMLYHPPVSRICRSFRHRLTPAVALLWRGKSVRQERKLENSWECFSTKISALTGFSFCILHSQFRLRLPAPAVV